MMESTILQAGFVGAITAIALLRVSWGRPRRSSLLNALGWLALAFSLVAGGAAGGAWGVTVVSLWAMGAAFTALAMAAWHSPPARRAASNRRAGMLPERGEALRLWGRITTFLIVVVAGLLASLALAVAARWAVLLAGASEADANVTALFVAPLGWSVLAFLLLMTASRARQFALIAVPLATAIPAIVTGGPA